MPTTYDHYLEHVEEYLVLDTPLAFGLHPNAEIDFRTTESEILFTTLIELQPRDAGAGEAGASPQDIAQNVVGDILDKYGEKKFDMDDIMRSLEDQGPYQNVFLQECENMNALLIVITQSLHELNLGFAGELTMSENMENLMNALYLDRVSAGWAKFAWPSLRALGTWLFDMSMRLVQLEEWTANPMEIPKVTWLSGLINPQSFLTAVCQVTAQKNQWELDKLGVLTEVQKKMKEGIETPAREGAYCDGMSLQGARFDMASGMVEKSKPKEMFCPVPVINCKAVGVDKLETVGVYYCPCYKTVQRGPTFVFCAQLKTKAPSGQWVLAGVGLIMDAV